MVWICRYVYFTNTNIKYEPVGCYMKKKTGFLLRISWRKSNTFLDLIGTHDRILCILCSTCDDIRTKEERIFEWLPSFKNCHNKYLWWLRQSRKLQVIKYINLNKWMINNGTLLSKCCLHLLSEKIYLAESLLFIKAYFDVLISGVNRPVVEIRP